MLLVLQTARLGPLGHILAMGLLALISFGASAQTVPFVWQVNVNPCAASNPSRPVAISAIAGGGVVVAAYCPNDLVAKAHRILPSGQPTWVHAFCSDCREFSSAPIDQLQAQLLPMANSDLAILHAAPYPEGGNVTRLTSSGSLRHATRFHADSAFNIRGYAHPSGTLLAFAGETLYHLGGSGATIGSENLGFDPIISANYFYFQDLAVGSDNLIRRALRIEEGAISFGFPPRFRVNVMNFNLSEAPDPAQSMDTFAQSQARIHGDGTLVEFGNSYTAGGNFRVRKQSATGQVQFTTGHFLPETNVHFAELNPNGELAVANVGFSQSTIARFDAEGRLIHSATVPFTVYSMIHAANGEVGIVAGESFDRSATVYRANGGARHAYRCRSSEGCIDVPELLAESAGIWFLSGKRSSGSANSNTWVARLGEETPGFISGFEP